jgi:hypothetical protein
MDDDNEVKLEKLVQVIEDYKGKNGKNKFEFADGMFEEDDKCDSVQIVMIDENDP